MFVREMFLLFFKFSPSVSLSSFCFFTAAHDARYDQVKTCSHQHVNLIIYRTWSVLLWVCVNVVWLWACENDCEYVCWVTGSLSAPQRNPWRPQSFRPTSLVLVCGWVLKHRARANAKRCKMHTEAQNWQFDTSLNCYCLVFLFVFFLFSLFAVFCLSFFSLLMTRPIFNRHVGL